MAEKREAIDNVILGAGIAGLGTGYSLRRKGEHSVIFEKEDTYGGLCASFEIDGFRFDRFVHFTFTDNEVVNRLFKESCGELITHIPNPYNFYHGKWIKHPAQNNLYPLPEIEKKHIIDGFLSRPRIEGKTPINYEEWLRWQFGDYFAEHFPLVYTRKYWMKEARELRTEWVGKRIYQPSVDEVIRGSKTSDTPVTYYAKEMRYPKKGGFKALLGVLVKDADVRYTHEVDSIDLYRKEVRFRNGKVVSYKRLFSSIPLPVLTRCVIDVPDKVTKAAEKLECTCGYHISIALKTKQIPPPYLWWYIYDEDILAARVYSPSLKSPDNVPDGCSSLQMEVYCKKDEYTEQQLLEGTVVKLVEKGIIKSEDIIFTHVGFEPYANVIFSESIYESREVVRDWLKEQGIETIGRFGEWDYLWSDQSLLSGMNIISRNFI